MRNRIVSCLLQKLVPSKNLINAESTGTGSERGRSCWVKILLNENSASRCLCVQNRNAHTDEDIFGIIKTGIVFLCIVNRFSYSQWVKTRNNRSICQEHFLWRLSRVQILRCKRKETATKLLQIVTNSYFCDMK